MTGPLCLDSSVLIRHLRGESEIVAKVNGVDRPILPVPVLGELLVGARLSNRPESETLRVRKLAGFCQLASPDAVTASTYAEIKVALRRAGTPIPENDIWIAALCIQHDWELAFRDKHFPLVPGLRCLPW